MTAIAQRTAHAFNSDIERCALTPRLAREEILNLLGMIAATAACHSLDLTAVMKEALHGHRHGILVTAGGTKPGAINGVC